MPTLTTYHLAPAGSGAPLALHFGRQGIGYEEAGESWPSDSLWSALVAQAALLEGLDPQGSAPPEFAKPFLGDDPPLAHSSLFPRIGDVPLLPRPALELRIPDAQLRQSIGKGFKKLRYLSPALFAAACTNAEITDHPVKLQGGAVWLDSETAERLPAPWGRQPKETVDTFRARLAGMSIWVRQQVPHVTLDRANNASAFYEVGRVVFAAGCGLALLVDHRDPRRRPAFEALLELLGESGIGGKRSSGYGAFQVVRGPDQPFPEAGPRRVLLSRCWPRNREEVAAVQSPDAAYQLVEVGGWLLSPGAAGQQRQRVTLLAEGSVLAPGDAPILGRVGDVRPDYGRSNQPYPEHPHGLGTPHPVFRSGLALAVPAHAREKD